MSEKVNPLRHVSVFVPELFKHRIDVIGAGATGSRVVTGLAKLGIETIHVWDFDKVEEHNIANQTFHLKDIGKQKVTALTEQILSTTGITVVPHDEKVDGTQQIGPVIFLLTDTMQSRKEIWDKRIKLNISQRLMVETRMGVDSGRIYTVEPAKMSQVRKWEETLCESKETETSACGSRTVVGQTAEIVSGFAVWQLINWFNRENGTYTDPLDNEIIFSVRPPFVMNRTF